MSVDKSLLQTLDIFEEFEDEELDEIAPLMQFWKVMEGETIMKMGEPAQTFFIVLKGNYLVYFKNGRAFTLHEKGSIMGWSTVVTPFTYKGTAIALTDGEVLAMRGQDFNSILQSNASLTEKIMYKINEVADERIKYYKEP